MGHKIIITEAQYEVLLKTIDEEVKTKKKNLNSTDITTNKNSKSLPNNINDKKH